jgi:hypothetical protein
MVKPKQKIHRWNVILVTKFKMPHRHREFNVESKNVLGATMKANKLLKEKNKEDKEATWRIQCVYWLDPIAYVRNQE